MKTPYEEAEIKAFDIVAKTLGQNVAASETHLVDAIADAIREAEERGAKECAKLFEEDEKAQGLRFVRRDIPKHPENHFAEVEIRTAAPPGHILDDKGVVRKVLGVLPVTADGCVVGANARLYGYNCAGYLAEWFTSKWWTATNGGSFAGVEQSYSTPEAALAAKDSKGGGA